MRRVFLFWILTSLSLAAQDTVSFPESAIAQEQRLRRTLENPSSDLAQRARDEIALAELLVFSLERDFQEAVLLAEPHLRAAESATPSDPVQLEKLRRLLGFAYSYTNRVAEAETLLVQARDSLVARLGPDDPKTLSLRGDLGVFYGRNARPDLAETEMREVARAFTAHDPNSESALHAQTEWAIVLGRLGRWADAERILRDVLARRITLIGPDDPRLTQQLNLLAWVLYSTGRAAECVPLLEQLVTIREQERGPDATATLTVRFNLAATYARVGRYDEAEKILLADLARAEARAEGLHEPAGYLRKLGEISLLRQRPEDAVATLARAEALFLKDNATAWRDAESRDFESTRYSLTRAFLANHQPAEARRAAADWLTMFEEQFRQRLLFTSEADRLAFHREERPFDLVGTVGDADLIARASLHFKGLVLDSLIEDQALAQAARDPAIAELLSRYRATLEKTGDTGTTSSMFENSEQERLERELARRTLAPTTPRAALRAEPADVLATLATDTAFVDFLRYTDVAAGAPEEERYLALIGTRRGWQIVRLGAAAPLDAAIERYHILTTRGGPLDWAREVRRLALDPVRAALPPTITHLILAPDSNLHGVAFAALPEDTSDTFTLARHRFSRVTSARDLLPRLFGTTAPPPGPSLIIAAPTLTGELGQLPPLPEAMAEGRAVAAQWPDSLLLTGDAAIPGALAAHASPRVLHIATHAIAATDATLTPTAAMRKTGLALAGENGWLDALQIAALDLRATKLVFLSACRSGGGTTANGEGVLGLQRGFARAGAQALVTTLWPVSDEDSRAFTGLFYEAFARNSDPAVALHDAQLAWLAQLSADGTTTVEALRRAGAHVVSVRR